MKKIVFLLVFVFTTTLLFAQEAIKKELVKKGNLIEAAIYHDNDVLAQEGFYTLDGKLQGLWTSYDTNGKKTAVANYNKGEKVGTWYFYQGDVLHEVNYDNNSIAKVTTWKESETQVVSNFE